MELTWGLILALARRIPQQERLLRQGGWQQGAGLGLEGATRALAEGVAGICRLLSVEPDAFRFAFFGLPAYGEDTLIDPRLHDACGRILGHARYACGNDMVCGWDLIGRLSVCRTMLKSLLSPSVQDGQN